MPAALADIDYLAARPEFLGRVRAAMTKAAVAVGNTPYAQAQPTDHERLRRALATNVLQDPADWAPQFALAVATNPVVTLSSDDAALEFTVASVWDAIAGAGPPPA